MLTPDLVDYAFTALAVSALSVTVAKSNMFRPLRLAVEKRSTALGHLAGCPYCLSHWFAAGGAWPLVRPDQFHNWYAYAVVVGALVAASALVSGLTINWLHVGQAEVDYLREENERLTAEQASFEQEYEELRAGLLAAAEDL